MNVALNTSPVAVAPQKWEVLSSPPTEDTFVKVSCWERIRNREDSHEKKHRQAAIFLASKNYGQQKLISVTEIDG